MITREPAGVGVVEVDELVASSAVLAMIRSAASTTCCSPITRAPGSASSPLGQQQVLDLGHGVHRVHERNAPPVARQGADLAGQPVVRVDHVVVAGLVRSLGAQHVTGERAQLAGRSVLASPSKRPGDDVADENAGTQLDDARQRRLRSRG